MAGRPLKVAWHEDPATLRQCYQEESVGEHRTRLHALWLLRQGRRLREVATLLGVQPRTVQNWVQWYRQGGLAELRRHCVGGRRGAGARPKLTPTQQEALRAWTRQGRCFRVAEAQAWVQEQYGVRYSYWGLWRLLHRLKLRPKVPRPQAARASVEAQAAWRGGPEASP